MTSDVRSWNFRLAVIAVVAAIGVSMIYLPQALLTKIAEGLHVDAAAASLVATAVQVGYALGIFLLVPLGDRVHPRRQITVQTVLLTAALLIAAVSPELISLVVSFFAVGIVANLAQILIPVGARLSPPEKRGQTTATIVGAVLSGIFAGRILASILADPLGWRLVVVVFALIMLATIPFSRRVLNEEFPHLRRDRSYGRLLVDTLRLIKSSPPLTESALMQFFAFATFTSLWTVSVLQLTGELYGWTILGAGLFGLVGLLAGAFTPFAGRAVDRWGPVPVAGVFFVIMLAAAIVMIFVHPYVVPFAITMFVVTLANQTTQSANQLRSLSANPRQSAGANTVFMVVMFLGGSLGAFLGPIAFFAGGMTLVAVEAVVFIACSLLTWSVVRVRERARVRVS